MTQTQQPEAPPTEVVYGIAKKMSLELDKLALHTHGAVISMMTTMAKHREATLRQEQEAKMQDAQDAAMKDAIRRRFDVLAVWSIDRLGRSTATVATVLAELDAAGVAIYADREGMDATTPHGRAMLQMAAVFAELERGMIRERVVAGLTRAKAQGKQLGRPKVAGATEDAIRNALSAGKGILKVAAELGVGSGTVQRVRREMAVPAG